MIHNSEAMSYRQCRAWWQMEKDGFKQMDLGVVHVAGTGLHWGRPPGLISCQQEQLAMWHLEQPPVITKIIQLRRQVGSQCCVPRPEHRQRSCTGTAKGSILLPEWYARVTNYVACSGMTADDV